MTQTTISRPRMEATYALGAVRARRWHCDGDVRGYRPPRGWMARADLTDINPITGRTLPCAVWWLIETKEWASQYRPQVVPPWGRWIPKNLGAAVAAPSVESQTAESESRRPRSGSGCSAEGREAVGFHAYVRNVQS